MMQIIFTVLVITIHFGTQIKEFPSLDMPIVCDMSSDIFSRVLIFKVRYIYAGAQKTWVLLELH
jgi:phosphoserine aminotransferase